MPKYECDNNSQVQYNPAAKLKNTQSPAYRTAQQHPYIANVSNQARDVAKSVQSHRSWQQN